MSSKQQMKLNVLTAAVLLSLVVTANTRAADDPQTQPTPANSSAQDAQPASAKTLSNKKQDSADVANLEGITVTATIAGALQSAQEIKQTSKGVVDAVVSQDIGKMPDNSVADALQRVPGVQVAPGGSGETTTVLVRGLPNIITTLNGNEIFDETGRGFAFQNLPATAVRALEVYKTSDASMAAGGIAGTINIALFKPFDFDGAKVAGTLTETYSHYAGDQDPNASLLLSDRWDTSIGNVGALANFSMGTQHYNVSNVWTYIPQTQNGPTTDSTGNAIPVRTSTGDLVATPQNIGSNYTIGYRKRPEFNYALQWKPSDNDNIEAYVTGMYTWFSDYNNNSYFLSQPQNQPSATSTPLTNLQVGSNCYANQQPGWTNQPVTGQTICDATGATYSGNTFTLTSPHLEQDWGKDIQNSIGVKWHEGPLKLSTDFTQTLTSGQFNTIGIDAFLKGPITTVWSVQNGAPSWYLQGAPQLDANNFYLNGLFEPWTNNRAKENAWRADGTFDLNFGPISSVQFGVRYADHTAESIGGNVLPNGGGYLGPPGGAGTGNITATPNPANQYLNVFPLSSLCLTPATPALPQQYLAMCTSYMMQNQNAIRAFYGVGPGLGPVNPGSEFNIEEKNLAGYFQVNYQTELLGIPISGQVGIRAENVKRDLNAFSYDQTDNNYTPLSLSTTGNNYLPNFGALFQWSDSLQSHLNFSKTITYPDFASLNPSLTYTPPTQNSSGMGSSGNPYLTPVQSKNSDATLEWYFSELGSLTGDVFYRDIKGYQENFQSLQTIQGYPIYLSQPESAGSGHLYGGEVAYQQAFSFLPGPWDGLGTQLNYTYIKGSTLGQTVNGIVASTPLQNVSRNNYNVVLFYEKYGFSARLAYDFRNKFISGFAPLNTTGFYVYQKVPNQLDFSIAYDLSRYATIVMEGTNITGANAKSYWGSGDSTPNTITYQDRTLAFGVRVKF